MLWSKFFVYFFILAFVLELKSSEVRDIRSFEVLTQDEMSQVIQAVRRYEFVKEMISSRVLGLLLMVRKHEGQIDQIIAGNSTQGLIFFLGGQNGCNISELDPELVSAVENVCKKSGARFVSAVETRQAQPLLDLPGYKRVPYSEAVFTIEKVLES